MAKSPVPKPPSGTHQPIDTSVKIGKLGPYDPAAPPGKAGASDKPASNIHSAGRGLPAAVAAILGGRRGAQGRAGGERDPQERQIGEGVGIY